MYKKQKVFIDAQPICFKRMSGIGHLVFNTIIALSENPAFNEKYRLVLFVPLKHYRYIRKITPSKVEVRGLVIPAARPLNLLNYLNLLPPIDLFLGKGHYLFMNYSNYPVTRRSRSYTWVHDMSYVNYPDSVSVKLRQHLKKHLDKWIRRSTLVTISHQVALELSSYFKISLSEIEVVYPGVDTTLFRSYPKSQIKPLLKKIGIDSPYFIFVGNLEPRKNLIFMLDVFQEFASRHQGISLLIVGGGGWNNESIISKIEDLKNDGHKIKRPAYYVPDNEIAILMSASVGLLHFAHYEGYGITPIEATACGVPVILSDLPVFRETLGDLPYYANNNDVKSAVSAMERAWQQGAGHLTLRNMKLNTWSDSSERVFEMLTSYDV